MDVLLVEDNPDDADLVWEYLADGGFRVTRVDRLSRAEQLLTQEHFDVAVLDLGLPDSRGYETFRRFQEVAPDLPVVILTILDDEDVALQALRSGGQDYLFKSEFGGAVLARALRYAAERKRIELELAKARDEALEYSRMKSRFLANATHELRNPLHGILGTGRLLLEHPCTEDERREFAQMLVSSGEGLLRLVNDLLDLSRVEAGKMEIVSEAFDTLEPFDTSVELLRLQAEEKGLRLETILGPHIPPRVEGDAGRIRQIVLNLLGNAIKFTEHGSITVGVEAQTRSAEAVSLRFFVKDTGPGITPSDQRIIFEPFGRASSSRKSIGTGLGLAISSQLVQLMGGELGVDSEPGTGSTFWVRLVVPVQPTCEPPTVQNGRPGHLLVADDDPVSRRVLQHVLSDAGHTVRTVTNGQQVLAALLERPCDLVILDSRMPVMDGLETARQIRRFGFGNSALPLVALTADNRAEERRKCLEAGMNDFLTKPVEPGELRRRVAELLANPKTEPPVDVRETLDVQYLRKLRRRMQGENRQSFEAMLQDFLQSIPVQLDEARAALAEGDAERFSSIIQNLKGASGWVGGQRLAGLCLKIEAGQFAPSEALARLEHEYERFRNALTRKPWQGDTRESLAERTQEAETLFVSGRWEEAEAAYSRLLAENPADSGLQGVTELIRDLRRETADRPEWAAELAELCLEFRQYAFAEIYLLKAAHGHLQRGDLEGVARALSRLQVCQWMRAGSARTVLNPCPSGNDGIVGPAFQKMS
ncbi:MAG: response regulator [Armatimonadetes bacterium]|nr:response regulator [Armatimonadota bacterium]